MDVNSETTSASRGTFIFKPTKSAKNDTNRLFRDKRNFWYQEFTSLWFYLNRQYEKVTADMFTSMMTDLLKFIKFSHSNIVSAIPTAALLTGINMPDHLIQFKSLEAKVKTDITPHVSILSSQNCGNLKSLMESMINQFVNDYNVTEGNLADDLVFDDDDIRKPRNKLKKSNLNMMMLQSWYEDLYPTNTEKKILLVIIPDFESFNDQVIQNFISIVSLYLSKIQFVFIFGIATLINKIHTSLPYHVISALYIQVFKCESSMVHLNKVLDEVFLSLYCPFQIGGKVFQLFTEIFLYYDFSVHNFVQNIKFAMMEHFFYGNAMALCQMNKKKVYKLLQQFNNQDCENLRQLLSFRKLVESRPSMERIRLLKSDRYFLDVVYDCVVALQKYIRRLHLFLRCLHLIVADLPGTPLGKNVSKISENGIRMFATTKLREIYAIAASKNLPESAEYKESFKLLNFQSIDELRKKIDNVVLLLDNYLNANTKKELKDFHVKMKIYKKALDDIEKTQINVVEDKEINSEENVLTNVMSRMTLKEELLSQAKQKSKPATMYDELRKQILSCLDSIFKVLLVPFNSLPFYEIFFFDDITIRDNIIGMHRSAIHNALTNPAYYLQCDCCRISHVQALKPTMPDICLVYKLHLEWGKMINLYDWLQAFLSVVDPQANQDSDDNSKKIVRPELQARFTQAVSELEYLGFIKKSKRKTDHVIRLTWGG